MSTIIETNLVNIIPNEFPRKLAWNRVKQQRYPKARVIDLDSYGISINQGERYPFSPADGHHRLARFIQIFGPMAIARFTIPDIEYVKLPPPTLDEMVENLFSLTTIRTFPDFLSACLHGEFYEFSLDTENFVRSND